MREQPLHPGANNIFTRHPARTILGSLVAIGLCGSAVGVVTSGGGESSNDHGAAIATYDPSEQDGTPAQFRNTNPQGRLACTMTVTHTGAKSSNPYKLHTYVTQGTPPADAYVTYSTQYGNAQPIGPFITTMEGEPAIPAVSSGNTPLAHVEGHIVAGSGATACAVTLANQ
jgi:hypothetical protein